MRKELAEYRSKHHGKTRRILHQFIDEVLYRVGCILGRIAREGSPWWHRLAHLVAGLPSLSGSIGLRAGFYRSSMSGVDSFCATLPGLFIAYPRNVSIGERVFINRGVFINAIAPIEIGADVLIGPNVVINSGNHSFQRPDVPINLQGHEAATIRVGDDVWIGANCVLTAGIEVGHGKVIGAGSVVTRSLPPMVVAGGVPAKVIKGRDGNS